MTTPVRSASSISACVSRARFARLPPAMSSTWSWKPPVEPSPRIGGGLKAETSASGIAASFGRTRARMPARRSSGDERSCQGSSSGEAGHGVRVLRAEQHVEAADHDRVAHAGRREQHVEDLLRDALGALERRAVGQLPAHDEVALILGGHEARRHPLVEHRRGDQQRRRRPRARAAGARGSRGRAARRDP